VTPAVVADEACPGEGREPAIRILLPVPVLIPNPSDDDLLVMIVSFNSSFPRKR